MSGSVWLCVPAKRPMAESTLPAWHAAGYKIAVWRDEGDMAGPWDVIKQGPYPGYAVAVNHLIKTVMECCDTEAEWFVTGGDDTLPDQNHTPEEIAFTCVRHFGEMQNAFRMEYVVCEPQIPQPSARNYWSTFGVMQPTGDRFAAGSIDRICGSPWMGREFCQRMNGGKGPFWPEYRHMFPDEELQAVATKLGVLWQRPDLIHLHRHFMRESDDLHSNAVARTPPEFLREANSPEHWVKYRELFQTRKYAGFPGHEPLPA